MKKLLVLVLILTITAAASAVPHFYITDDAGNDEITLMTSDTIELLMWYAEDPIISYDFEVGVVSGPGTLSDPAITATGRNPDYDYMFRAGEDIAFSYVLQKYGINTYVPPHPQLKPNLWGSSPLKAITYGNDNNSIWKNDGINNMNKCLNYFVKLGFKFICHSEKLKK